MKQSFLVLGADQFVGSRVVAGLAATDWASPIAGVRLRGACRLTGVEERCVDPTSVASVRQALRGVAGVVNCTTGSPEAIVSSARALLASAASAADSLKIIHLSSMTVYGGAVGLVGESAPLRGDVGAYSAAHVAGEAIVAAHPRVVIFRPGCEFGAQSDYWGGRIAQCLLAGRLGDLGAGGDGYCNWVDIDDVVQGVIRAAENSQLERGIFNLAHPQTPTWNEFLTRYAIALRATPVRRISHRRLRVESRLLAAPLKIAEIAARACRINARHLPVPIPPALIRVMGQEIKLDVSHAGSALGMRWKSLDTCLQQTADCFSPAAGRN